MCCSVLLCVAVTIVDPETFVLVSRVYCVAARCSVLQCLAMCCSVLLCVAATIADPETFVLVCCSVVQCAVERCSALQSVAMCCLVFYCAAACHNVLQCVSSYCTAMQREGDRVAYTSAHQRVWVCVHVPMSIEGSVSVSVCRYRCLCLLPFHLLTMNLRARGAA